MKKALSVLLSLTICLTFLCVDVYAAPNTNLQRKNDSVTDTFDINFQGDEDQADAYQLLGYINANSTKKYTWSYRLEKLMMQRAKELAVFYDLGERPNGESVQDYIEDEIDGYYITSCAFGYESASDPELYRWASESAATGNFSSFAAAKFSDFDGNTYWALIFSEGESEPNYHVGTNRKERVEEVETTYQNISKFYSTLTNTNYKNVNAKKLQPGKKYYFNLYIPTEASDKVDGLMLNEMDTKSSNSGVASIDDYGVIHTRKAGSTHLYAAPSEDCDYYCDYKVVVLPEKVKSLKAKKKKYKLTLTYKAVPGATGYQVYASKHKSYGYHKFDDFKGGKYNVLGYKISKNMTSHKYYFKVRAFVKVSGKRYYGSFSNPVGTKAISITTHKSGSGAAATSVHKHPTGTGSGSGGSSGYVYLSRTGSKFHRYTCRTLARSRASGSVRRVTRSWAINNGYSACKVCRP